jgi:hypothetical protein
LTLFDKTTYTGMPDPPEVEPDAPIIVVIIAGTIGGVISCLCFSVVVYIVYKAIKNKGLTKESGDHNEEEDRMN